MKHEREADAQQERALLRRFGQLREYDAERLPDFPDERALVQRAPVAVAGARYPVLALTSAAALVVAVGIWVSRAPESTGSDPGAVYAGIMSENRIATDELMRVSAAELPEISTMSGIYGEDLSLAPLEITN